jgi:hypothetical protein
MQLRRRFGFQNPVDHPSVPGFAGAGGYSVSVQLARNPVKTGTLRTKRQHARNRLLFAGIKTEALAATT